MLQLTVTAVLCSLSVPSQFPWMDLRGDPVAQADALIANMTLEEKVVMLHGDPSGKYVGNVPRNKRLGIPPLNLNDGPQGFRDGGSTAWPSGMTVGMTWDEDLALLWGQYMGKEFFDKGANVQLGPGLCIARVPRNGRTFEYISGEDPFLGYTLVQPVISGIQSQNVIANAKHWVNNNQETHRTTINEIVDERTRFEIYYPPFAGATEADVGSMMCSYNKINGRWSCENIATLDVDLKQRLAFKGWVMSDWTATHSTSINMGLDQEMPGDFWFGDLLKAAVATGEVKTSKIDDSVRRILVAMFKFGIFDHTEHWTNTSLHKQDVTSKQHSILARNISAAASVLLKNNGDVLPLQPSTTIAVIGSQAKSPTVSGQGSGHVTPTYVIDPFSAISARTNARVTFDDGQDPATAAVAAASADVAIVFVAADSAEGFDRKSLNFDDNADALIAAVAKAQVKTIVVGVNPGPVLMPWSTQVAGIVLVGMPGLEYGHAITDVLFGDVNPSGRLSVTMPNVENEIGFTPEMWPGVAGDSNYSERLNVGYRWYHAHNVSPKFAFGHGLSYTSFNYSDVTSSGYIVTADIKNTGVVAGAEVVQLYLTFPTTAGEPPRQLKGFQKIMIASGETTTATFLLNPRAFSTWDISSHAWVLEKGSFVVEIGASSDDIRSKMTWIV